MDPKTDMGTVIDEAAAQLFEAARQRRGREAAPSCSTATSAQGALYAPTVSTTCRPTASW